MAASVIYTVGSVPTDPATMKVCGDANHGKENIRYSFAFRFLEAFANLLKSKASPIQ